MISRFILGMIIGWIFIEIGIYEDIKNIISRSSKFKLTKISFYLLCGVIFILLSIIKIRK